MEKKRRLQRTILLFIIFSASFALAACSRQPEQELSRETGEPQKQEAVSLLRTPVPEGMELAWQTEEISLPEIAQEQGGLQKLEATEDGLEATFCAPGKEKEDGGRYLLGRDGSWREITPQWLRAGEHGTVIDYAQAEEGDLYLLYCLTEGEKKAQWVARYRSAKDKIEDLALLPADVLFSHLSALSDGTLLLFEQTGEEAYVYPAGEKESSGRIQADGASGCLEIRPGQAALRQQDRPEYRLVDVFSGGNVGTEVPAEAFGTACAHPSYLVKQDGVQYLLTENGISRKEGKAWSLLLPAQHTVLADSDFFPQAFCKGEGECFYVSTARGLYCLQPVLQKKQEEQVLRILSCGREALLQSAALSFESSHPGVRVEYESLLGDGAADTSQTAAAVTQINTRVLSGELPDVLVMNGLPMQSYTEKGLLEDLSGVLQKVLEDPDYYGAVISEYETGEGLFCAAAEFTPFAACLRDGVPQKVLTLEGLYQYLLENPESTGFVPYQRKGMLETVLYRMYGKELVKDGKPDQEALACYLKTWKLLADRAAAAGPRLDKMPGTLDELIWMEKIGTGDLCFLKEVGTLSMVTAARTEGYRILPSGKNLPGVTVSVLRQAAQKELALSFVKYLFEEAVPQTGGRTVWKDREGLQEAADQQQELQGDHYEIEAEDGFVRYSLRREDIDGVLECYEACAEPAADLKDGLYEVLVENSGAWLEGEQELKETVEQVLNAIRIYEEE